MKKSKGFLQAFVDTEGRNDVDQAAQMQRAPVVEEHRQAVCGRTSCAD